jgi:medium-chain acyl-[acyl-carrier-protein] hydrolase
MRASYTSVTTPWLVVLNPVASARLRLICCPHAGAGASMFLPWTRVLPASVEVCAIQMPGREERLSEPPITSWDQASTQAFEALAPLMDRPFALFGHSVGATLAFELARSFRARQHAGLVHLFVSGREAPHVAAVIPPIHHLPDEEFVREVRALDGIPESLVQNAELMDIFLPILRGDFHLAEVYAYRADTPLTIPISAYGGVADASVPATLLDEWRAHTSASFRRVMFPGGHFFVNEHRAALLTEMSRELRTHLNI